MTKSRTFDSTVKNLLHDENPVPSVRSAAAEAPARCPVIDSADLLRGHGQILISHGGCTYTLRQTRGDKLILTK